MKYAIIGCGDVGRRIIKELLDNGVSSDSIVASARSQESVQKISEIGVCPLQMDLDALEVVPDECLASNWVYLVPPSQTGLSDRRAAKLTSLLDKREVAVKNVVVISTTGVYGDAGGEWVDETTIPQPTTERAQRRLDMEKHWHAWAALSKSVTLRILRVPGIYAYSRIPMERLRKGSPVVRESESGFSNRIHADDLARACVAALEYEGQESTFNVSDGKPSTITAYLQAAAEVVGLPALPEISMAEAQSRLSPAMLSYLLESRKIDNRRMLKELKVALLYTDYRVGLRH